jgi:hypothetical protein
MRIALVGVLTVVLAGMTSDALAELYRWRDPQTGTIKYSSYPPPWYGDETREATAPKVEVLGERQGAGDADRKPADEMAEKVAEVVHFMEQRREQLLSRMTVARASAGFDPADPAFKADVQAYRAVTRELDKFDPKGAAARRKSDAQLFQNLGIETEAGAERPTAGGALQPVRPPRTRGAGAPQPPSRDQQEGSRFATSPERR